MATRSKNSTLVGQQPVETTGVSSRPTYISPATNYPVETPQQTCNTITAGIVILIIITVVGIGIIIYAFIRGEDEKALRELSNPTGKPCTNQSECGDKHYCDGNGVCLPGMGEKSGSCCSKTGDCDYGLICLNGECTSNVIVNDTVASRSGFLLSRKETNGSSYLTFSNNVAVLSSIRPTNFSFSYTSSTQELSVIENGNIMDLGINTDGQLVISPKADKIALKAVSNGQVQVVASCRSVLSRVTTTTGTTVPVRFPQPSTPINKCFIELCPNSWGTSTGTSGQTFVMENL